MVANFLNSTKLAPLSICRTVRIGQLDTQIIYYDNLCQSVEAWELRAIKFDQPSIHSAIVKIMYPTQAHELISFWHFVIVTQPLLGKTKIRLLSAKEINLIVFKTSNPIV